MVELVLKSERDEMHEKIIDSQKSRFAKTIALNKRAIANVNAFTDDRISYL